MSNVKYLPKCIDQQPPVLHQTCANLLSYLGSDAKNYFLTYANQMDISVMAIDVTLFAWMDGYLAEQRGEQCSSTSDAYNSGYSFSYTCGAVATNSQEIPYE
tara:strand:- start:19 stop:324 length:306 start_codon:yes stop_codon:yes gene_type:complete